MCVWGGGGRRVRKSRDENAGFWGGEEERERRGKREKGEMEGREERKMVGGFCDFVALGLNEKGIVMVIEMGVWVL